MEKNSRLEMDIQDDAYDASQDVLDIDEERRVMGEKVMALARIRAIKSDPRTVKVIYSEGYTPGRKFDVPGTVYYLSFSLSAPLLCKRPYIFW